MDLSIFLTFSKMSKNLTKVIDKFRRNKHTKILAAKNKLKFFQVNKLKNLLGKQMINFFTFQFPNQVSCELTILGKYFFISNYLILDFSLFLHCHYLRPLAPPHPPPPPSPVSAVISWPRTCYLKKFFLHKYYRSKKDFSRDFSRSFKKLQKKNSKEI